MSGRRYLLDTNAIVALLKGSEPVLNCIETAEWVGISIISKIEFLAFPNLTESDGKLFDEFQARIDVIDLGHTDESLLSKIIDIRKLYKKIKLPDAIIISTAIMNDCTLITADKDLQKVEEIEILSF